MTPIFNQYLKHNNIPVLEINIENDYISFRWKTDEPNFEMPIEFSSNNKNFIFKITNNWKKSEIKNKDLDKIKIDNDRFLFTISN